MTTVLDNLKTEALQLRQLLSQMLVHSSIKRRHDPNTRDFVFMGGHFAWEPLGEVGRQLQAKVLEEYRRFYAVLCVLLRAQPEDTLGKLEDANNEILELIQQQKPLYTADVNAHFDSAFKALNSEVSLLDRMFGVPSAKPTLVPDTNALIFNPDFQTWTFDGISQFTIVLTPPVLSELDILKVNHRVESVRDKAEKVIRQIKEFRRRATTTGNKLSDGIALVNGISDIVAVATEPHMESSLPWLDSTNKDDRLLATVMEVMRARDHGSLSCCDTRHQSAKQS